MPRRERAPALLSWLERTLDRACSAEANPLRQLGALAFWLFWLVVASGAYVYAFYDTSVAGAYASVEDLARQPLHAGSMVRGLHRYAADALMAIMALHLVRELACGHFRGFRWFSWITGVPLVVVALVSGLVGYWLVWDVQAQFIAVAATEWLGSVPGLGQALVRNFITAEALSDRFFSLLVFVHIGVTLILLAGMWLHIQRISAARTHPHRHVAWAVLIALLALALAQPTLSQAAADLARVPLPRELDWYFLFPLPLGYRSSPAAALLLFAAAVFLLLALPWLERRARAPAAVINTDVCNGCARCLADCPYGAVVIVPGSRARAGLTQAAILTDLCAGCGICVGACPTSAISPARRELRGAVELPGDSLSALRERLDAALDGALDAADRVVVVRCEGGPDEAALANTSTFKLPCVGMLPPSFAQYALKRGARGVLIAGCGGDECEFRLGAQLTAARMAGTREPRLRGWARDRVRIAAAVDRRALERELAEFRAVLEQRESIARATRAEGGERPNRRSAHG